MSETSTSDIDCNDLLNQIGLCANENKDENNIKETKKRKKVRSKNNQSHLNKNKTPLLNLSGFISSKKSDFELDDDFSEKNLPNQIQDTFEIDDNNDKNQNFLASNTPQNITNQISTDIEDIHSYSSTNDINNIKINDKNESKDINDENETENLFHIDSNSDDDTKENEKGENNKNETIKDESNKDENNKDENIKDENYKNKSDNDEKGKDNKLKIEKKIEKLSDKEEKQTALNIDNNGNNNQKRNKKNANNKNKKAITRINLSQYLDLQPQSSMNDLQPQNSINDFMFEDNPKSENILQKNDDNDKLEEERSISKSLNMKQKSNNSKENQSISEIEKRVADYLNISIKKVISDFTAELSNLLNQADSFDEIIKQYISEFKKNILDCINFQNNDLNSFDSSFTSKINDLSSSIDYFKVLFKEIDSFVPFNPDDSFSALSDCKSKIESTKNFINGHISPLITEMHKEVYKSSKMVKIKIKKFKIHRQKFLIYDKLFDLEKRELDHQIESRISEIKRKGIFYQKTPAQTSPSVSFYEENSITDQIREYSMTPAKDEIVKELGNIIKLLKVRRKKSTEKMNLNLSVTDVDADNLSLTNLSTSFFPISPPKRDEFDSPSSIKHYYYPKVLKDIRSEREESRSLRKSYQSKIQEFCSASSILTMEYQMQFLRQQQQQQAAAAASISLLQTNPQNFFSKTMVPINDNNNNSNNNNNNNTLNAKNSRTSELLQIADEDDVINEELLCSLRQQADEMNRKMVNDANSTTAFIRRITRGTRRHSEHRHHHHRHSRIAPDPSLKSRKLELSSDISLSNMSDDNIKYDRRKNSRSSLENEKPMIRKRGKSIQNDLSTTRHQDSRRKKSHNKH